MLVFIVVDYDYDFYGYSDYRGGYSDPYYDEYYRNYEGEYFYDYPQSGVPPTTGGPQKTTRNSAVGFISFLF